MDKADQFFGLNADRFARLRTVDSSDDMHVVVELSPYDTPKAVAGRINPQTNELCVQFRYIDDEPGITFVLSDGVQVEEGKHSGKILRISLAIGQKTFDVSILAECQKRILSALTRRILADRSQTGRRLNYSAAKEVIRDDLKRLLRDVHTAQVSGKKQVTQR